MSLVLNLSDLSPEEQGEIRKLLRFKSDIGYVGKQMGAKPKILTFYHVEDGKVYLPYMMGRAFAPNYEFPDYPQRKRFKPVTELREHQIEVIEEAYPILKETGGVIISTPTGSGKTRMGIELSAMVKGKILILVPMVFLADSWLQAYGKHTDCESIMILQKKKDIEKWLDEHGDLPDILIVPCERTNWLIPEIREMYRILILDEAHRFCTPEYSSFALMYHPRYIIPLTATMNRSDGLFIMMEALAGQIVRRESKKIFRVFEIPTDIEPPTEINEKTGRVDFSAIESYLAESVERNNFIADLVEYIQANDDEDEPTTDQDESDSDEESIADSEDEFDAFDFDEDGEKLPVKILILMKRVVQLENLSEILENRNISHSKFYGKHKSYNDSMIVLGTFKKMSTGFDEELMCKDFNKIRFRKLILGSSMKDHLTLIQSLGRVFRDEHPDVYDLVDNHPIFRNHIRERRKLYEKYNAVVRKGLKKKGKKK